MRLARLTQCLTQCLALAVTAACGAPARDAHGIASSSPPAPAASLPTSPAVAPRSRRAPEQPFEELVFGHRVVDPYRWMEAPGAPELLPWLKEQDRFTRRELGALPGRDEIVRSARRQLAALGGVDSLSLRGDVVYFLGRPPGARQARLLRKPLTGGEEAVMLDPDLLSNAQGPASINQWRPSRSGRYIAYVLGFGGNENSTLRILDTVTGKDLPESIDKVYYANIHWLPDDTGFVYQRHSAMGAVGAEPMFSANVARLHRLGQAMTSDVDVFGKNVGGVDDLREKDFTSVELDVVGQYALAIADVGTSAPSRVYAKRLADLTSPGVKFMPVFTEADGVHSFELLGDKVYALSEKRRAERELVVADLAARGSKPLRTLLTLEGATLSTVSAAKDGLYLSGRRGMDLFVAHTDFQGRLLDQTPVTPGRSIRVVATSPKHAGALLSRESFIEAESIVRYQNGKSIPMEIAALGTLPTRNGAKTSVRVEWVTSADGTKVPMTMLEPGDGTGRILPTMMTAYGTYGRTTDPYYSVRANAWIERGGRYVICHARGGGELGEEWHRAGMREKKRNTVDDTIACAEHLRQRKEATSATLAFHGRSAGGITASTIVADRPELFAAVVVEYPVTEITRFEHSSGGSANVPEYGSATTKEGYEALLAVDGYNRIQPGIVYPQVLVTTAISDNRVPVWMPAKFAARLQSFVHDPTRVKLRVDFDDGHGLTSTTEQTSSYNGDMLAFAWNAMVEAGGIAPPAKLAQ